MKFLQIKITSDKGRGVFADKHFSVGETIEVCPVLLLSPKEAKLCAQTMLDNYLFEWENEKDAAIVLGYGSIYNHSYHPNAEYLRDFANKTMIIKALTDISPNAEIFVNYNGEPNNYDQVNIEGVPPHSDH